MRMKCRICGMFHSDGGECPSSLEPLPGFSWTHSEQKEQRKKYGNKMPEVEQMRRRYSNEKSIEIPRQ